MKIKDEKGQIIGEVFTEKEVKCYKTSNKFCVCFLISKGFEFLEEVTENDWNNKLSYIFSFPIKQEGLAEALEIVKQCRLNNTHFPFPEKDTKEQLTFKTANKIRWNAVDLCYPNNN